MIQKNILRKKKRKKKSSNQWQWLMANRAPHCRGKNKRVATDLKEEG
jgi:hypothetical protein